LPFKRSGSATTEYWIQEAIQKKGALRQYVQRKYGSQGFTTSKKTGRKIIRKEVLEELKDEPGTVGKRARLALTLRKLKRR